MKKLSILAFALFSSFLAGAQVIEEVKDSQLINKIQSSLPGRVAAVYKTEMPSIFEVHTEDRQTVYTDTEGKYFLIGAQMVDFTNRVNFTSDRKLKTQLVPWSQFPADASFKVVKGDGSRKLAVFTDPDCPYCKRLEADLQSLDNVTITYFMMPIDKLHPKARSKATAVWCSPDKAQAWNDLMTKGTVPTAAACDTPFARIDSFAMSKHITGTPTIINSIGQVIEGAPQRNRLETFLNQKAL